MDTDKIAELCAKHLDDHWQNKQFIEALVDLFETEATCNHNVPKAAKEFGYHVCDGIASSFDSTKFRQIAKGIINP